MNDLKTTAALEQDNLNALLDEARKQNKRANSRDRKQYLRGRIEALKDLRSAIAEAPMIPPADSTGADADVERVARALVREWLKGRPKTDDVERIVNARWPYHAEEARAAIAVMPPTVQRGAITDDAVRGALQDAWADWCEDAQAYPGCFEVRGGELYADFQREPNFITAVRFALEAHIPTAQQWRPIAEAEESEATVQLWCKREGWIPKGWHDPVEGWGYADGFHQEWIKIDPTHFQFLPESPKDGENG